MDYTIELDNDTISEIVRKSIEEMFEINIRDVSDSDIEGQSLLAAMFILHRYYSTVEQHGEFVSEFAQEILELHDLINNDLTVIEDFDQTDDVWNVETVEDVDGSLVITLDASPAAVDRLAGKGIEYSVILGALGDPTSEQLLRWAERGKQEENTDDIMRRFNEAKADRELE